jgi:Family of unknown function (DUF5996)
MTYRGATWPELPLSAWKDTYATLHLWTQIVGKIRLAQTPWLNHSWHVVLYVSARGLTTSAIPYCDRSFQLDFDFLDHVLRASASDGGQEEIGLYPRSVADFYAEVMRSLAELASTSVSTSCPMRFPMRSASAGIASTPPTTASMPSASGAYSFSPHAFSAGSARASSASAARSISSGAASISP